MLRMTPVLTALVVFLVTHISMAETFSPSIHLRNYNQSNLPDPMPLPMEPSSLATRVQGVRLETKWHPTRGLVTGIVYKKSRDASPIVLGEIVQRFHSKDFVGPYQTVTLNLHWEQGHSASVGVNELRPEVLLSSLWQMQQVAYIINMDNELLNEMFMQIGDELISLLFFTWTGIKDLIHITEEFDKALDEAIEARESLSLRTEGDRQLAAMFDLMIDQGIRERDMATRDAYKSIAAWGALDIATWAPKTVLKPLALAYHKLGGMVGRSAFGRVSARLVNSARIKGLETAKKVVSKPFTKVAVRIGLMGLKSKVSFQLLGFRTYFGNFRLVKAIENSWNSSRLTGFKKFVEPALLKCGFTNPTTGGLDFEKRRLWLLSTIYSIPINLTAQYIERGDNFIKEIDRSVHDVGVGVFNSLTWGRCSAEFDKKTDMTFFERWKQRQVYQYLNNYTDTMLTYAKLTLDAEGMTDTDWEELRRRFNANFAYTLTKGPFIGAVTGERNGEMNHAFEQYMKSGNQAKAMEEAATEFITRFGNGLFSWSTFVAYRESNVRPELAEQQRQLMSQGTENLAIAIEMIQSGHSYNEIPELTPSTK